MKCQACGERDAVTEVTRVMEGESRRIGLCEACAAEKGIEVQPSGTGETHLGGFLATIWKGVDLEAEDLAPERPCRGCGATFADFRTAGRFGCAECWRTFEPAIRVLLRRYHGSTHHLGRAPEGARGQTELTDAERAERLREELKEAVEAENFEAAAQLRDRLKELS